MTDVLTAKDVMTKPVTISKSQSITEALDKMIGEGIDPLIVMSGHEAVGTVSRRSIAEKLGSRQKAPISTAKIHVAGRVAAGNGAVVAKEISVNAQRVLFFSRILVSS